MLFTKLAWAAALSSVAFASPAPSPAASNSDSDSTTLSPAAVQSGSFFDGTKGQVGVEAGEAASLTSTNNFINFCAGKQLTNGLQITTGSCNGIIMGDIPAKDKMTTSMIIFPPTQATPVVQSDVTFNITVKMNNLITGNFTNADETYYSAPQFLGAGGLVVGHTHVTVADLGPNLNPTTAPDATQFAFFKGIDAPADGEGILTATVTGGLPAGFYRVCTIASGANHQPVYMPVAQRQGVDDCTKFQVGGDGTTANVAANNGSGGIAAAAAAASAVADGPGALESGNTTTASATSTAAAKGSNGSGNAASATSAAAASNTGSASGNRGKFGGHGRGGRKQRARRVFIK